jgi:hypothetical protein
MPTVDAATRPFIFVSIPRAASSSVHYMFGLPRPKNASSATDVGLMDNHAPCDTLLARYGPAEFHRRFKFCFVRNPWDRCVSWYCHHIGIEPYSRYDFKGWIKAGMPHHWDVQNETDYRNARTPLAQHPFITSRSDEVMVDFIGRVERMGEDLAHVFDTLGMAPPPRRPHINRARARLRGDYRNYYDDETAREVGRMLETDVAMFRYQF